MEKIMLRDVMKRFILAGLLNLCMLYCFTGCIPGSSTDTDNALNSTTETDNAISVVSISDIKDRESADSITLAQDSLTAVLKSMEASYSSFNKSVTFDTVVTVVLAADSDEGAKANSSEYFFNHVLPAQEPENVVYIHKDDTLEVDTVFQVYSGVVAALSTESGKPVSGIRVVLRLIFIEPEGLQDSTEEVISDQNGIVHFEDVAEGYYFISGWQEDGKFLFSKPLVVRHLVMIKTITVREH
ncbi:MAG: hypothetical protein HQK83_16325 [Fibrobacteria bacterium]|nr:hypothetical protein [Fibrobacteria bacterium]